MILGVSAVIWIYFYTHWISFPFRLSLVLKLCDGPEMLASLTGLSLGMVF